MVQAGRPQYSYRQLRYTDVIGQTNWWSCGLAATATLLSLYCEIPVTETELLQSIGNEAADTTNGISLLHIKRILNKYGVDARGFQVTVESLRGYFDRGGLPVIAHTLKPEKHFVLAVGLLGEYLIVADPSFGARPLLLSSFENEQGFSGMILVPGFFDGTSSAVAAAQKAILRKYALRLTRLGRLGF